MSVQLPPIWNQIQNVVSDIKSSNTPGNLYNVFLHRLTLIEVDFKVVIVTILIVMICLAKFSMFFARKELESYFGIIVSVILSLRYSPNILVSYGILIIAAVLINYSFCDEQYTFITAVKTFVLILVIPIFLYISSFAALILCDLFVVVEWIWINIIQPIIRLGQKIYDMSGGVDEIQKIVSVISGVVTNIINVVESIFKPIGDAVHKISHWF